MSKQANFEKDGRNKRMGMAGAGYVLPMSIKDRKDALRMVIPDSARLVWSDKENRMVWEAASEPTKDVKNAANKR